MAPDCAGSSLSPRRRLKGFPHLARLLRDIFTAYRREVEAGQFPAGDNAVHMEPGKLKKFQDLLGEKQEV